MVSNMEDEKDKNGLIPIYFSNSNSIKMVEKIVKSDEYWKSFLSPESYQITRKNETEPAFTGKYHDYHEDGIYQCVCCGTDLFESKPNLILVLAGPVSGLRLQKRILNQN